MSISIEMKTERARTRMVPPWNRAKIVESYDDFDMYEQLLKEFLESGNVDGDAPRSAAKPAKRRKIVDRRASKGRKLRYHVQEPLVNFVSSIEEEVPQWADKLFTQLFASKG